MTDRPTSDVAPGDIFLLIGQSNMAGRGPMDTVPPLHHPAVRMFRSGQWIPAVEPLHTDKSTAGVGLGMSFALALAQKDSDRTIGLLPCAVGGTPLARWIPGADLYAQAVATARAAGAAAGRLKGILWHQGENDSGREEDARSYAPRLGEMIAGLRSELDAPEAPFIAGELGPFLKDRETCRDYFGLINEQIRSLGDRIPLYGCVSAAGLVDKGDGLHFGSASLRAFGRRYAEEYLRLAAT